MPLSYILVGCLLVGCVVSSTAFAETDISTEQMEGSVVLPQPYPTLSLHACARDGGEIECDYLLTSHPESALDYKYGSPGWASKFVDQFRIDHPLVNGYFVNGRGDHVTSVTLGKNDWVKVIQRFGDARPDITSGRVVFPGGNYIPTTVGEGK